MKRGSTLFLQAVVVLVGLGALAFLLGEPHVEGRNVNATLFQIYFQDPFLAYVYTASLAFFLGLYQAFKVLGYVRQDQAISEATVKALRTIKYCAVAMIGFAAGGVVFLLLAGEPEPPGVVMSFLVAFGSLIVASVAAMLERILQNAADIKSENDLTV